MLELKVTCTGDFSNGTTVQESISFPGQHLHESQTVLYCTVHESQTVNMKIFRDQNQQRLALLPNYIRAEWR